MIKLSLRLLTCARYTDGFINLADIGTDHALLPIHAIKEGYVLKAQAIDNKEGPYVIAFSNVKKQDLEEKIKVVKADGISKIDDDTDVCVIAGMGGFVVSDIITKDSIKNIKRFILQPNSDSKEVRLSLAKIGMKIIDELVIYDNKKYYDIIVAEHGEMKLTSFEAEFGPINLKQKPHFFQERIKKEMDKLEQVLTNMPKDQSMSVRARIALLKEALK